jgi:hypothetical protein
MRPEMLAYFLYFLYTLPYYKSVGRFPHREAVLNSHARLAIDALLSLVDDIEDVQDHVLLFTE